MIFLTEIDGKAGPDIEAGCWLQAELIAMELGAVVIGRWIYDIHDDDMYTPSLN